MVSFLNTALLAFVVAIATASPAPADADTSPAALPVAGAGSLPKIDISKAEHPTADSVPIPASAGSSLEKRTLGCIYATQDGGFNGASTYECHGNNACLFWNPFWRFGISSFGPDEGQACVIYHSQDCSSGGSVPFVYPGYGNLGEWNDNMGSYRCFW